MAVNFWDSQEGAEKIPRKSWEYRIPRERVANGGTPRKGWEFLEFLGSSCTHPAGLGRGWEWGNSQEGLGIPVYTHPAGLGRVGNGGIPRNGWECRIPNIPGTLTLQG